MKKTVIGIGTFVLLCGIGFMLLNDQKHVEDEQTIRAKNPELFVDSSKSKKALPVTGTGKKTTAGDDVVTGLETSLVKKENENTLQFLFEIKNSSEQKRILQFTSSQKYEYEIYKGTELVERFSDGKSFMQVLKDVAIAPNETVSFDIQVSNLSKGKYTIIVWPVAKGVAQLREQLDFTVD
ncbi:BsuPI-related putative proteinase inhibitor [Bacillus timonensis]|uniref:BsuPI-related putative proteinase inhibitor n=1 Tax=Bacillus timonensis TaxID=1033734 RepID=UPI00028A0F6F|nr:BsuPI-related putative proteinase inhibitor [Bacillus timonensis]